ncbi:MAG: AMIN-like domain-containing (lipo)protein [Actinomycetota bacterium]
MRMSRIVAALLAAVFVLAACRGDDDGDVAADATTTTVDDAVEPTGATTTTIEDGPTSTTEAPPTTPECPPLDGATTDETASAPASDAGLLIDVALTTGDCTDAVTFTFDALAPDAPGYRVAYEPGPVVQDGSGEPVAVAGGAYLAVRFEPSYGYDFDADIETYTGPDRVSSPGAFFVQEVVDVGDFEGVVTWVIGVDEERPYTATADGSTTRTVTIELR